MQKAVETEVKNDVDTRADVEKTLDPGDNVKPVEATETNVKPVEPGENKVPENKNEIEESNIKSDETPDNSETITKKIGLQYFAEKAGETAIDYSKLTYDEKVDLLKNAGFDDSDIEYLATELEGTQIANAIKLQLTIDLFGCTIAKLKEFAKLEQTQIDDVWSLFLFNVSSNDIAYIITDDNIFKNALKLADAGVYCDVIKDLATDDNICSKALKLAEAGVYDSSIKDIVSLEETQFENALKFVETGVKGKYIKDLAQFEGTQLDTAIKLAQAGVNGEYIKDIAQFEGTQLDNAIKLVQAGVTGNAIKDLAQLEGTQVDNAIKLVQAGVTGNAIKDLAKLEGTQLDNAIKLAEAGVRRGGDIKDLATTLEGTQFDNAIKLAQAGVNGFDIKDLVTDDKACNNAIILKAAGIGKGYIKDLATDDRICNNAIKLAEAGFWDIYIKDLATLEETQIDNAIKLKNAGFDGSYIKDLATLKGTQIDNAIKLKEARILAIYIKDLVTDDNKCNNMLKYINMGIEGDKALELINNGIDLLSKLDLVEVSKENQTDMFKNFFANNSNVDEIIKNTDFSQYGKDGIPLEYSRTEFLGDLSSELSKLPTESQNEIVKKLGIDVIKDATGNITGYDGIIDLTKLSSDGDEGKVLELANRFILNNKVVTGNSESDNALNSLISGMPEFINTIGKQQHNTHSYSLDTHILETYKAAISDSGYDDLSNYQKYELKLMTILHDISKGENTADDNHPIVSAKYAKDILSRYSLSESTQYDVVNNILNHHWGKDYNTESVSTETTAVKMGTVSNYNLQKIFAKADLTGMGNSEFSSNKLEGLSDDNQENLVNTINKTKETTPLVYTTPIIKPDLIPNQEITLSDGTTKTIKSFNLAELPDDYDMEEFGFLPGTKASDVTLGVHTANSQSQFNIFEMLTSDPITSSPQSVSIVSKDNNALFKRFGVAIDLKGSDVINATHYDQGCGTAKTGNQLIKLATGDGIYESWREILPGKVQEKLDITSSEYSQLASIMEDYKYLTQIKDSQEITIGEKTFSGSEIKTAISTAQSELMQMTTNGAEANDKLHSAGDITELVVKRAEVMDNTYVLRYNSADDINNENIPTDEREALSAFLGEIPENSTVIFTGYDGYLYSSKANQWKVNKNATKNADTDINAEK